MILEREKWKIANELTLYLSDKNAYLVNFEGLKKREILLLKREVGNYKEVSVDTNEFELRIRPDLRLEALIEGEWRLIKNQIGIDYSGFILTQIKSDKGKLDGTFEAIICPTIYPGKVFFVSTDMEEYDSCFNEMVRVINCNMFKKTRKWIPGHRYDSTKETYFYLGEYLINLESDIYASTFNNQPNLVHLVSKNIKGCKTIKDVFFKHPLAYEGLEVLEKLPLMVDSGEALIDDMKNIKMKDLRLPLFENFLSNGYKPSEILSSLAYDINEVEDKIKDYILEIYNKHLYTTLLTYWKSNSSSPLGKDGEDNVKEAIRLTCRSINPTNIFSNIYYEGLFNAIGIDIKKITNDVISKFTFKEAMFSNFEKYVNQGELYFKYHDNSIVERSINQRSKSLSYYNQKPEITKLEKVIPGHYLVQEIKNIVNEATAEVSFDVTYYQVFDNYTRVKITLDDIIKHRKGIQNIPENLKRDIMDNRFQTIIIEFDKDSAIV